MSRAQDVLHLSRFARHGGKNRSQSEFLTRLGSHLPAPRTVRSDNSPYVQINGAPVTPVDRPYSSRELDVYKNCPFQFYCESVLGLSGRRDTAGYVRFHGCVYGVLNWIRSERRDGRKPDENGAFQHLDGLWAVSGLPNHPYEALYRSQAVELIREAVRNQESARGTWRDEEWTIPLTNGTVSIKPDEIEVVRGNQVHTAFVRRVPPGRAPKDPASIDDDVFALYSK